MTTLKQFSVSIEGGSDELSSQAVRQIGNPAERHRLPLVRGSMVLVFLLFGYQKWFEYEAKALIPFISNGPLFSGCTRSSE
jgi:uncharacterized membrane protein YkgB